ncbi:MAG: hypothetical protein QGI60_04330 [archaeon]|nr:hypothetical protein [archaeon]
MPVQIKQEHIFFAAIFVSTFVVAFLFSTVFTVDSLFSFELEEIFSRLTSLSFILFLIISPAAIALITMFSKKTEKKIAIAFSVGASAAALILANILFPTLRGFVAVQVLYIISIPAMIETAALKFNELKKWVAPRTVMTTSKRAIMLTGIGLVVLSAMVIMPQQEEFVEKLEIKLLTPMLEGNRLQSQATDSIADLLVKSHRMQIDEITSLPNFDSLEESTDENAKLFHLQMTSLQSEINKRESSEKVKEEMANGQDPVDPKEIVKIAKEAIPEMQLIEQLIWLVYGLMLAAGLSFLGSFVITPLSMLYAIIIEKTLIK